MEQLKCQSEQIIGTKSMLEEIIVMALTYLITEKESLKGKKKVSLCFLSFFPTWLFVSWPGFNQRMVKIDLETKNDNNREYSKTSKELF